MLVGEGATAFAKMMGMQEEDLGTDYSHEAFRSWTENSCQPNYYRNFVGAEDTCPPYDPPKSLVIAATRDAASLGKQASTDGDQISMITERPTGGQLKALGRADDPARLLISETNHDTIGILVVDELGDLACGTTTNGASNKIAGRVGDSPVAGAGCYVDNDVGGAAATGDGDVMMR